MGTKIFGLVSSNAGMGHWYDVQVKDFDDFYGLDSISTPIATQKAWKSSRDYTDIAVEIGGVNDDIGTDWEDLTNFDQDNNYLGGNAVSGLTISSNAVGDRYNAWGSGTTDIAHSGGARQVRVYYLDTNWDAQTQDVYVSGLKPVPLTTDILIPNKIEVISVGNSGAAAGDIVLAMSGTRYLKIDKECNESFGGYYYVPDDKWLIITDAYCYPRCDIGDSLEFAYRVQEYKDTGEYIEKYRWAGSYRSGGSVNMAPNMNMPLVVGDRCRVRMRVKSAYGDNAKAIGYLRGYLTEEKD